MTKAVTGPQSMTFALTGGLDLVTPPILITPGSVISGANYEPRAEGYRRIEGIERLDGQLAPSAATYSYIAFNTGTVALVAGQTVTGATSGATGILLVDGGLLSGTYAGSDAVGYLALKAVTGTFQVGENLQISGVTKCVAASVADNRGALNDADDATWLADAVLQARTAIQPVPGGGPIRGAWFFGGSFWAFRDDDAVTPTKCQMYKATTSGWSLQSLGFSLPFTSGGTTAIAVANTVTGATSSATGIVSRVLLTSGTWAGGDAAGRLILSAVTGTFQAENLNVGVSTNVATIAAAPTANVLTHGGRYEFENHNFYGATSLGAMYGVNGVGFGFEWDGTTLTPILTGASDERPIHLATHKQHLFLAYRNGSLQGSQSGLPQGWDGSLGATVFGIGKNITGLMAELAGVLAIFSDSGINVLSGSTSADFQLDPFTLDSGALEWTIQSVNGPTYMDQGGVRNLSTSQAFGDFKIGALSQMVQPLLDAKKLAGITVVGTLRVRAKNQYRVFFSDGTGLSIYVSAITPSGFGLSAYSDAVKPSTLPFDYGTRVPTCLASCLDDNQNEVLLMGCADGYVYQLDKGTSMDGDALLAFMRLAFNNCGSPNQNKRFQKMSVQTTAAPSASLFLTAAFSDGDPDMPSVPEQSFDVRAGGGFWDEANWNNFNWSSSVVGKAEAHLDGLGNNFSPTILTTSTVEMPHTLNSMTLLFSMRGPIR